MIQAISIAGGLTSIANGDAVRLTRSSPDGKTVTAVVSVDAITDGDAEDIPLQAGDRIYVEERPLLKGGPPVYVLLGVSAPRRHSGA